MSILINKNSRVLTQGITGKTGQNFEGVQVIAMSESFPPDKPQVSAPPEKADYKPPDGWKYAGFWERFCTFLMDAMLLFFIIEPLLLLTYGWEGSLNGGGIILTEDLFLTLLSNDSSVLGAAHILIGVVLPAAIVILFWRRKNATPGKMITHMKIVDAKTGKPPSFARYILRYCVYFASAIPFGLGFFWIAFDKKKQGWHDKLAGTVVLAPENQHVNPWLNDKIEFIFGKKS